MFVKEFIVRLSFLLGRMVKKHTGNAENQPGTDSLLFSLLQFMVSYIRPEASEKI
jgi:hypothetical protein